MVEQVVPAGDRGEHPPHALVGLVDAWQKSGRRRGELARGSETVETDLIRKRSFSSTFSRPGQAKAMADAAILN